MKTLRVVAAVCAVSVIGTCIAVALFVQDTWRLFRHPPKGRR